jgi:hypothetical protein
VPASRLVAAVLFLAVSAVTIGCGQRRVLPTASDPQRELVTPTPNHNTRALRISRGPEGPHIPPPTLIHEAKEGLGAILTGEQAYFQRSMAYTAVPGAADFRSVLGVYFGDLLARWSFSVGLVSATGFVAQAQGRDETAADGLTVTLTYQRDQPPLWHVEHRRAAPETRVPARPVRPSPVPLSFGY